MRKIRFLAQKIIKRRQCGINFLFDEKIIVHEWVLFGKFVIKQSFKSL